MVGVNNRLAFHPTTNASRSLVLELTPSPRFSEPHPSSWLVARRSRACHRHSPHLTCEDWQEQLLSHLIPGSAALLPHYSQRCTPPLSPSRWR